MPLTLSFAIILYILLYLITPIICYFNHQQFSSSSYNNRYIESYTQNPHEYFDLNKKNMNIDYFLFLCINDNKKKTAINIKIL